MNRTFNPAIPDGDKHALAIGTGLLCKKGGMFLGLFNCGNSGYFKSVGLDLAFVAMIFEQRTVENNENSTVNGAYDVRIYDGVFTIQFNF